MRSQVQVLIGPPLNNLVKINLGWGISSAGRAPALHAGGQRFDPAILHHLLFKMRVLNRNSSIKIKKDDRKLNISSKRLNLYLIFESKFFKEI